MYYLHFDNNRRADSYTGYNYRNKDKAIKKAKSMSTKVHVSKQVNGVSPMTGKPCKLFKEVYNPNYSH